VIIAAAFGHLGKAIAANVRQREGLPSQSGRPTRRLAPDRERHQNGKTRSGLPLAFKVARLFKKPIEEIFELDADCGIDIPV